MPDFLLNNNGKEITSDSNDSNITTWDIEMGMERE